MHKFIFILAFVFFSLHSSSEEVNYLLTASAKDDIETVKAILESGADVNVVDSNNLNALMYAARKNNSDIINLLIKNKIKVNHTDDSGWTALMYAAKKNYTESIK